MRDCTWVDLGVSLVLQTVIIISHIHAEKEKIHRGKGGGGDRMLDLKEILLHPSLYSSLSSSHGERMLCF